jgi:hypothetical protein
MIWWYLNTDTLLFSSADGIGRSGARNIKGWSSFSWILSVSEQVVAEYIPVENAAFRGKDGDCMAHI